MSLVKVKVKVRGQMSPLIFFTSASQRWESIHNSFVQDRQTEETEKKKHTSAIFLPPRNRFFCENIHIILSSSFQPKCAIKNWVWLVEYSSGFPDILLNCAFVQLRQYAVAALSCGGVEDKYERRQVSLNFHQHSGWVAHLNKTKSQESKVCSFPSKSVFIVRWVLLRPTLNQNKLKNNVNMDSLKSALMSCLSLKSLFPVLKLWETRSLVCLPLEKRRLRRTCKTW